MTRDFGNWLEDIGLGKYAELLVENEIDFDVLPDLSEADLAKLGLPIGWRRASAVSVLECGAGGRWSNEAGVTCA